MDSHEAHGTAGQDQAGAKFPLVGIGASVNAMEALRCLLSGLPPQPGFAIVLVLQQSAGQGGPTPPDLQDCCQMPVVQVTQHPSEVQPNRVYLTAPGARVKVEDRYLYIDLAAAAQQPVDYFFHSLAMSHGPLAVGVLLAGLGRDGCEGLAALRGQGGTTIVQAQEVPSDAGPHAAIAASLADIVLPARDIAARLLTLCAAPGTDGLAGEEDALQDVLALLYERTGHDFRHYKRPAILRRLENRMHLHGVRSVAGYRALLAADGEEAHRLLKGLLIGVTGFFRDRAAFEQLRQAVLPVLLDGRTGGELRLWVAACSTGQEAYSLAMLLADLVRHRAQGPDIRIFASDIDEQALGVARAGLYPESIREEVPPASLDRYFTRSGKQYRVRAVLRDMVTFASHNLLRDPPFCRLDLVSCRNFLIYLDRTMQKHVLQRLHFGLVPDGYLFLGSAETADAMPGLFARIDRPSRIYRALPARTAPLPGWTPPGPASHPAAAPGSPAAIEELRERLAQAECGWEQLQSHNEELSTLNAELKARLEDTGKAHDDLSNLIASVDLATIFVDPVLVIQRFTPRAAGIFNLIERDVGRSLLDITHRLEYPQIAQDVTQTFNSLQPLEREVTGSGGRHYIVRVRPYRTGENAIIGAVLSFFDISARREAEDEARGMASDQEFLLHLGDCLWPLTDAAQLLRAGCGMLAERLGVPQLAYAAIRAGRYAVLEGHAAGGAPLQGEGELEGLGSGVLARWHAGEVAVFAAPSPGAGRLAALAGPPGACGAMLASVCRKGQHWLGFFMAVQPQARAWTAQEVVLFEEAAVRIGVEHERARSQAALLASGSRLRGLLRGFARAYWETDGSGQPFDPALLAALHPGDRNAIEQRWRAAVRAGAELDAEVCLRGAGPVECWRQASLLATPLVDAQGEIVKWIGCIVDAAEQAAAPSGSI